MAAVETGNGRARRPVKTGLEVLLDEQTATLRGARVGLICNPATVDHAWRHAADLFHQHPDIDLTTLFGPQHGIRGETQDNMIEWEGFRDARTGIMAHSLYGRVRKPTEEMLVDVDVLVFDVPDVGTRVYTFIYTMALAMQAAASLGKRFVVLDRPNPINGLDIEGDLLLAGHESFVGMYPVPMRHGMTAGELARMFNDAFGIGCDLEVIAARGWDRGLYLDETDMPWVLPSPNMPTVETAVVYPGAVYLEGTRVSEGRGTTRPFEIVGAPYCHANDLAESLNGAGMPGVYFRPHSFQPTFQKHAGRLCQGVQIHVRDRTAFRPVLTGIAIIKAIHDLYPADFQWQDPPYEYVADRLPFDVIAGNGILRNQIEAGESLLQIRDTWTADETRFASQRQKYLLY
ncbi:MAG: exo-beta-N-acetylmuramidase NamZ domain-containing protein [Blastocatellia bacterium]